MDDFYEKYGLITHGISRSYEVDLFIKSYGFDRANIEYLKIEDLEIKDSTWKDATFSVAKYLQTRHETPLSMLFDFNVEWSKCKIYQNYKFQINCEEILPDLWFNTGYSSTHGVWIIQELLSLYHIDIRKCKLLLHLPSMSEPYEVTSFFKQRIISNFKEYLIDENLSQEASENVIRGIENLNKILVKLNCGANDFFLIDNRKYLSANKSKVLSCCKKYNVFDDRKMKLAKKFLDYYSDFFKEYELRLLIEEKK